MRLGPIARTLGLHRLESNPHLLAKLLAPYSLVLGLLDLDVRSAAAGDVDPSLQVVLEGALLGIEESVLGGRGDLRFGQDGGDEDAGVGVGVAGVVDVCRGLCGLDPNVGAVASGLAEWRVLVWIWFCGSFRSFPFRCSLTTSVGLNIGYAQRLLVKNPTHRKVVFFASSGKWALMSSAAWSLPCV